MRQHTHVRTGQAEVVDSTSTAAATREHIHNKPIRGDLHGSCLQAAVITWYFSTAACLPYLHLCKSLCLCILLGGCCSVHHIIRAMRYTLIYTSLALLKQLLQLHQPPL
jgi:hypothetical protein